MVLESLWFHWELLIETIALLKSIPYTYWAKLGKISTIVWKGKVGGSLNHFTKNFVFQNIQKHKWNTEGSSHTRILTSEHQRCETIPLAGSQVNLLWWVCSEVRIPPMQQGVCGTQREALCHLSGRWLGSQMWAWVTWSHPYGWQIGFLTVFDWLKLFLCVKWQDVYFKMGLEGLSLPFKQRTSSMCFGREVES